MTELPPLQNLLADIGDKVATLTSNAMCADATAELSRLVRDHLPADANLIDGTLSRDHAALLGRGAALSAVSRIATSRAGSDHEGAPA